MAIIKTWLDLVNSYPEDKLTTATLQGIQQSSIFFQDAIVKQLEKGILSEEVTYVSELPSLQSRNINETYGSDDNEKTNTKMYSVKVSGSAIKGDKVVTGPTDPRMLNIIKGKIKAAGYELARHSFYGDSAINVKSFDGIKKISGGFGCDIPCATDGLEIADSVANAEIFQDKIMEALEHVNGGPSVVYMTAEMQSLITRAANKLGSNFFQHSSPQDVTQNFGRVVGWLLGIPIRILDGSAKVGVIGDATSGNIIRFDQTCGLNSDCSDIFFVKWNDEDAVYLPISGDPDFQYQGVDESYHKFQLDIAMCVAFGSLKSASVVSGIRK